MGDRNLLCNFQEEACKTFVWSFKIVTTGDNPCQEALVFRDRVLING